MIRCLFLSLMLVACTFPPASTRATEAAVTWPVEPPVQTEKRKQAAPKPLPRSPAIAAPASTEPALPPCPPDDLKKEKTKQEKILKKLDCLLERKQEIK